MIEQLKERWKGWKAKRFLEAHGCKTWREYEIRNDSDVGYMARWAHTYYHGYKYVFPCNNKSYYITANVGNTILDLEAWCEQNCQGKWRNDWHRGDWDHQGNFEFNGISGQDMMFFAFKEEADYVWFTLKWA